VGFCFNFIYFLLRFINDMREIDRRIGRKGGRNRERAIDSKQGEIREITVSPNPWKEIQGALEHANHSSDGDPEEAARRKRYAQVTADFLLARAGGLGLVQTGQNSDGLMSIVGTGDWQVTDVRTFDGDPPYPGYFGSIKVRRRPSR
jgi:hypothetical protein